MKVKKLVYGLFIAFIVFGYWAMKISTVNATWQFAAAMLCAIFIFILIYQDETKNN